nr:MAG TPA: hypothetical protein [Caudoviricetes sp.]
MLLLMLSPFDIRKKGSHRLPNLLHENLRYGATVGVIVSTTTGFGLTLPVRFLIRALAFGAVHSIDATPVITFSL